MSSSPQIKCIRPMTVLDIDRVMEIAARLSEAPQWGRAAFVQALEAESAPRRIALVAEEASGAKAPSEDAWPMYGLKPVPFNDEKPVPFNDEKPVPFNDEKPESFSERKDGTEWAEGERSGIVGFAVASVLAPESELELIAVCPEAQRRGVARRLFEDLAAELSAAGAAEVNLEVRAGNRAALGLYRKLGFVESGRRKGYYQNPVEDALQLRLGL